jgi:hypothetical protein
MTHHRPPRLRRALAIATLAGIALLGPLAQACTSAVARVDVYDRSQGSTLDVHRHRGRQYIVGQPGNEYAIRLRNCSDRRVLAVVSVDGVNVVTGETAAPDQSGYVIEPYGYLTIEGWRKDLTRTAAFYFSDPADAYAARTGRPDDLGVIGVALFRERESRRTADAKAARSTLESSAGAAAPLGTGHGRSEWSPAQRVEFERASARPDQRVVIRYDRRENLVAQGVLPAPRRPWHEPDPFPGTFGFVPDP